MKKLVLLITTIFTFSIAISNLTANPIQANEQTCEELKTSMEVAGEDISEFVCPSEYKESAESTKPPEGITETEIFKSNNESVAKQEVNELYITHFFDIHIVASFQEIDDEFFKSDIASNSGTIIVSIFASFLGVITFIFNFLTMLITNLALNDTLSFIFSTLITFFNDTIFDFKNPAGTGVLLTVLIALGIMIRNVFIMSKDSSLKDILKMIFVILFLTALVPISYLQIRPMLHSASDSLKEYVYEVVYEETEAEDIVIKQKRDIFNAQIFTAYMQETFGVKTIEELAIERNITIEEAEKIVKGIIEGNEEIADEEINKYENNRINTNFGTAMKYLLFSFVMLLHSILIFLTIGSLNLFSILLNIIETIAFGFIFINVILMMVDLKENKMGNFLKNRIQFLMIYILVTLSVLLFIQFVVTIVNAFVAINIMLLLVVEIILILFLIYIYKNKDKIIKYLSKLTEVAKGIITGDYEISDLTSDVKSATMAIKDAVIKSENGSNDTSDNNTSLDKEHEPSNEELFDEDLSEEGKDVEDPSEESDIEDKNEINIDDDLEENSEIESQAHNEDGYKTENIKVDDSLAEEVDDSLAEEVDDDDDIEDEDEEDDY